MSNKLAKMGYLKRDNLLINSDFRSQIINQKGIKSLDKSNGTTELTVDGWISYGINCSVSSNFVTYANRTSSMHTVKQPIKINISTKLTVYVNAFNIAGNIYIYLDGYEGQKKKINSGDNVFVFSLSSYVPKSFIIEFDPNASLSINRMKLEYGDCYTGMPAWNHTLELLKCQIYFQIYEGSFVQSLTSGTYFFGQQLRVMMAKDPLVKTRRLNSGNGSDISSKVKSIVCYKNLFDYIVLSSSHNEIQIRGSFELDAYDY